MPKSVNRVTLLGNVGKDVALSTTGSGTKVANFSLATSERYKDNSGNYQERTEWHNLVAFQKTAELISTYVKKGTKLYVEGKIQTRNWDDKETGQKRYRTEVIVNDFVLLGDAGGHASASEPATASDAGEQGYDPESVPF
jgi:single-strand DNA-binding protein